MDKFTIQQVEFSSLDGLKVTANYYPIVNPKGLILLCHRSHCNRGEYRETAPKFNALGFSCLAIDQRSGMDVFEVVNETATRAKANNLKTGYLDAKPDIQAAINYAYKLNGDKPIIILGSSYSAALALLVAVSNDKVKAVVVFSPGEYLTGLNVAEAIRELDKPIFATSAKKEIQTTTDILRYVDSKNVTQFKPSVDGFHGSKTLWEEAEGYETFWKPLEEFLSILNRRK